MAIAWAAGSGDNREFDDAGDHQLGDLVLIGGRWVFDASHEGWNELHPVKFVQKLPDDPSFNSPSAFPRPAPDMVRADQRGRDRGRTAGTAPQSLTPAQQAIWQAQTSPENRWYFHPLIDGCQSTQDPPPPVIRYGDMDMGFHRTDIRDFARRRLWRDRAAHHRDPDRCVRDQRAPIRG
jgi:hypothetical protein